MQLPQKVQEILEKMYQKFGWMNFEGIEMRRKWTRMTAEQLVYTFGKGSGWGHKASTETSPPSKDAIAQQQKDGKLFGWDIINGTDLSLIKEGMFYDITGQYFIEVPAVDHLDSGSSPQPPAPVPAPPAECQCEDALRRMASAIDALSVRLSELQSGVGVSVAVLERHLAGIKEDVNKKRTVTGKVDAKFLRGGDVNAVVE